MWQDREPSIMKIDWTAETPEKACVQIPIPLENATLKMTGPAIATAPDGAIWCTLLGGDGALVRIDPVSHHRMIYEIDKGVWMKV